MSDNGLVIDMSKNKANEYAGYWVAMVENKVIAIEKTAKEAFAKAKQKYPNKVAFVAKVPTESVMLL